MDKIINLNGNAVELKKIKAISVNDYLDVPLKLNQIKIEFNTRKEYIFNPNEKTYELTTINDHLIIDYPDGNIATENYFEIMQIWEDSIEEVG